MWLQRSPHPLAAKAEGARWGLTMHYGSGSKALRTPASLPPLLTQLITLRVFHCPCSRQNHLTGGVLTSGCASCQDCFALPFWLPRHKIIYQNQNRMALLLSRRGRGGRLGYPGVCAMRISRGGWAFWNFSIWPQTGGHSWPRKNPPILHRCGQLWHRSQQHCLKTACVHMCACMYMRFFFWKARLTCKHWLLNDYKKNTVSAQVLGPGRCSFAHRVNISVTEHTDCMLAC